MPLPESDSGHNARATRPGATGTIVLSSEDCRMLFIDNRAIELIRLLLSEYTDSGSAQVLPNCLRDLAREIMVKDSARTHDGRSSVEHLYRLVGSPSQPLRVKGFRLPGQSRQDEKVVLILSQSDD
jgi:hypothetical protein